jgi:hypothetical protein
MDAGSGFFCILQWPSGVALLIAARELPQSDFLKIALHTNRLRSTNNLDKLLYNKLQDGGYV